MIDSLKLVMNGNPIFTFLLNAHTQCVTHYTSLRITTYHYTSLLNTSSYFKLLLQTSSYFKLHKFITIPLLNIFCDLFGVFQTTSDNYHLFHFTSLHYTSLLLTTFRIPSFFQCFRAPKNSFAL